MLLLLFFFLTLISPDRKKSNVGITWDANELGLKD